MPWGPWEGTGDILSSFVDFFALTSFAGGRQLRNQLSASLSKHINSAFPELSPAGAPRCFSLHVYI